MIFEVFDLEGRLVTAYEVMMRHADFFGTPSHQDFVFAFGQDGELIVISGQMPFRMACTMSAFQNLYKIVWSVK